MTQWALRRIRLKNKENETNVVFWIQGIISR